jgi:hypothetical protein
MPLSLLAPLEQSSTLELSTASVVLESEININEEPNSNTTNNLYSSLLPRTPTIFPPVEHEIQQLWDELVAKVNQHYHGIDTEAIRIIMSAAVAQRQKSEVPIWIFCLGPSGTGKSLLNEILSPLPEYVMLNSITANTLLSGMPKAKGGESLLLNIGKVGDRSGLLVFPDFSTVISKKADIVQSIAGDLREVYDGHLVKHTGMGKPITWNGKVTIIAMCTPDLERLWGPMRGLGERFVQVRWGRTDGIEQAKMAYQQIGNEQAIKRAIADKAKDFYDKQGVVFTQPLDPIEHGVAHLAEITALLRTAAARNDMNKRLEDMSEPEGNTRFFKAIVQIARGHAAIFRRNMIPEDYRLAARVAIDSIPMNRLMVIRAIPDGFIDDGIDQPTLLARVKKPKTTVMRAIEELEMLGVIEVDRDNGDHNWYKLSEKFRRMKERAKLLWH